MPVTFEEVWAAEFAPLVAEKRRRAAEQRTDAFLDTTLIICGEEVRQMTPADMLHLDALDNPFIAGSQDGSLHFIDCAGFIWQLHAGNNHTDTLSNLWRRSRLLARLSARLAVGSPLAGALSPLQAMAAEISAYVDRMLLDPGSSSSSASSESSPSSAFSPEPKTHFLAPLIVSVAADLGHLDPMSGQLLAHTPLPRLLQYQRAILDEKSPAKTYTEIDSLRNRCMDRVNQLNAAKTILPTEHTEHTETNPPNSSVCSVCSVGHL